MGTASGFERLFNLVAVESRRRIVAESPEAVRRFLATVSVDELEASADAAKQIGFGPTPLLKAIERGAAYRGALFQLSNASRAAELLRNDTARVGVQEAVLVDALAVYLSAYIDATRNFIDKAIGQLLPEDDDTRARRQYVADWSAARKKTLSNMRQPVAHADVNHIAGIEEDGLWTPMILLELLGEESLVAMFEDGIARDRTKFEWRVGQLLQTAVLAIAQAEQQLHATADLLERKLAARG